MAAKVVKVNKYSAWIGFLKALKNVAVTVGIPAVLVLINSYVDWMPESWYPIGVPVMSILAYMLKNRIQFKG